jgi:glucose-6-phosphate isomerase
MLHLVPELEAQRQFILCHESEHRPEDQECGGVHSSVRTLILTPLDFLAEWRHLAAQPTRGNRHEEEGYRPSSLHLLPELNPRNLGHPNDPDLLCPFSAL